MKGTAWIGAPQEFLFFKFCFGPEMLKTVQTQSENRAGTLTWEKKLRKKKIGNVIEKEATRGISCARRSGGPLGRSSFPANASILRLLLTAVPGGSSSLTDKIKILKWNLI